MERVVLAWSGGKDAAAALSRLRTEGVAVHALLTTVNTATDRSSMHGVRRSLYERQAAALGLPLHVVELPPEPSNGAYDAAMGEALERYVDTVDGVAFGDLFLEDVRAYREARLSDTGLDGYWPIWGEDTVALARSSLADGRCATVVAVDGRALDRSVVGRRYDQSFLEDLPDGVDPCGEHGEFHTFVHGGPGFAAPMAVTVGRTVTRSVDGAEFHYADLRPAAGGEPAG